MGLEKSLVATRPGNQENPGVFGKIKAIREMSGKNPTGRKMPGRE